MLFFSSIIGQTHTKESKLNYSNIKEIKIMYFKLLGSKLCILNYVFIKAMINKEIVTFCSCNSKFAHSTLNSQ